MEKTFLLLYRASGTRSSSNLSVSLSEVNVGGRVSLTSSVRCLVSVCPKSPVDLSLIDRNCVASSILTPWNFRKPSYQNALSSEITVCLNSIRHACSQDWPCTGSRLYYRGQGRLIFSPPPESLIIDAPTQPPAETPFTAIALAEVKILFILSIYLKLNSP